MTCAEFEQKYPDIAEGDNEISKQASQRKSLKGKPASKIQPESGWSK